MKTRHQAYYETYRLKPGEPKCNSRSSLWRGVEVMSRAEVAKVMGITRQAVHQAERRAIAKLRSALFPMWRQMKEEGAL